jgi:hypothetical protein
MLLAAKLRRFEVSIAPGLQAHRGIQETTREDQRAEAWCTEACGTRTAIYHSCPAAVGERGAAARLGCTTWASTSRGLDPGDLPSVADAVSVFVGFMTADEGENGVVRLLYHTTREFLEEHLSCLKKPGFKPDVMLSREGGQQPVLRAKRTVTETCICYLSFDTFCNRICPNNSALRFRLVENPLYSYDANQWGFHPREADMDGDAHVRQLLENRQLMAADGQAWDWLSRVMRPPPPTGDGSLFCVGFQVEEHGPGPDSSWL